MSERGSFITENISCNGCLAAVERVLISDEAKQHGIHAGRAGGARAVGGLVRAGGGYASEERYIFENVVAPLLARVICCPLRIAVLCDAGMVFAAHPYDPQMQVVLVVHPDQPVPDVYESAKEPYN